MRTHRILCVTVGAVLSGAFNACADVGTLGDSNGQIVAWGNNGAGQCNVPSGTFKAIAGGGDFSVAMKSDGTLAAWGSTANGKCNVPAGTFATIAAGNGQALALEQEKGPSAIQSVSVR